MVPPGMLPNPRPLGGTTRTTIAEASSIEMAIRAVHVHLARSDVVMSPSKVSRMVRKFAARVTRDGCTFHEFLINARDLSAEARRRAVADPELTWFLSWWEDPTGRQACLNVMRDRGEL
jgi:hypothetical protein